MNAFMAAIMMPTFGIDFFEMHMRNKEMRDLMKSEEKYDVCIFEVFMVDAFLVSCLHQIKIISIRNHVFSQGIGDHFDCTIVTYTTMNAVTWVDKMTAKLVSLPDFFNPVACFC